MNLILHNYWRSSASFRVRIALHLKGLEFEQKGVNLAGGGQKSEAFMALNPQGFVPALEVDGKVITQSLAILEWLEDTYPEPPLLPDEDDERALVRAMAMVIACDIHPLNNLRVLNSLRADFGADDEQVKAWVARWVAPGFEVLDGMIAKHGQGWCYGDTPGLADCYLIPQVYNASRFGVDLAPYPHIREVAAEAVEHAAFAAAHPDLQPDAPNAAT
ncbi:maleylacetoacetate isomerase [Caulobacter sp. NIBR2454]|uniref:maleylacetoacetate isomerase n=1 Tax=Caulobacter sp. NIBR2454 TaxID=3015996 RepID=UPI0022B5F868|nr:maleylacetoacetate isomerase [Caulobacter sp. NIBR2454]